MTGHPLPPSPPPPSPSDLAARLERVHEKIAATGRRVAEVRIVAVTKGFSAPIASAALAAGCSDLGENYAQELAAKAPDVVGDATWHFLGALQRNKVAALAPLVSMWHGLDRRAALDAVAARCPQATVLVEVNASGDPAKHGCRPDEVAALVDHGLAAGLDVAGLMTVAPAGDRAGAARCFAALADLGGRLGLRELSMGMSDDFDVAAAEGATIVRLGRVLFGPRPVGAGRGDPVELV